jgi:mannose-6-phosphate isomerase-like protein (cupin superfamily)
MAEHHPDNVDVRGLALDSDDFRRVVLTGEHLQIVTMTLPAGTSIGEETHDDIDQVIYIVEGDGEAVLDGRRSPLSAGRLVLVRAGVLHDVVAGADGPLRLVTAYAPPEHPHGTVHATREESEADHHH